MSLSPGPQAGHGSPALKIHRQSINIPCRSACTPLPTASRFASDFTFKSFRGPRDEFCKVKQERRFDLLLDPRDGLGPGVRVAAAGNRSAASYSAARQVQCAASCSSDSSSANWRVAGLFPSRSSGPTSKLQGELRVGTALNHAGKNYLIRRVGLQVMIVEKILPNNAERQLFGNFPRQPSI